MIFLVFGGFFDFFIMVAMPAHILGRSRQLKNNIDVFIVVNVYNVFYVIFDVDDIVVILAMFFKIGRASLKCGRIMLSRR